MRWSVAMLGLDVVFLCGDCSGDPTRSDTGYVGTWVQKGKRTVSLIAIAKRATRILRSYTIERNGVAHERGKGPQRSFTVVSDSIADPPRRSPS